MLKYIIFYCCYIGNAIEPDGHIIIRYNPDVDTQTAKVEAFGVTWTAYKNGKAPFLDSDGGVKVLKSELILQHPTDSITAYLTVRGRRVIFYIPGIEVATLEQLPHEDMEYPEDF